MHIQWWNGFYWCAMPLQFLPLGRWRPFNCRCPRAQKQMHMQASAQTCKYSNGSELRLHKLLLARFCMQWKNSGVRLNPTEDPISEHLNTQHPRLTSLMLLWRSKDKSPQSCYMLGSLLNTSTWCEGGWWGGRGYWACFGDWVGWYRLCFEALYRVYAFQHFRLC